MPVTGSGLAAGPSWAGSRSDCSFRALGSLPWCSVELGTRTVRAPGETEGLTWLQAGLTLEGRWGAPLLLPACP